MTALLRPLLPYLLAGAALLALAGWGLLERSGRHAAQAEAAGLSAELRANAAALDQLRQHQAATVAALERQAAEVAARAARLTTIRRTVDAAPPTTACVAAPAVRAALDGLRHPAAGGPGGAVADPGLAPGLRAAAGATGGAGDGR